jgi:hypothetical protein
LGSADQELAAGSYAQPWLVTVVELLTTPVESISSPLAASAPAAQRSAGMSASWVQVLLFGL